MFGCEEFGVVSVNYVTCSIKVINIQLYSLSVLCSVAVCIMYGVTNKYATGVLYSYFPMWRLCKVLIVEKKLARM